MRTKRKDLKFIMPRFLYLFIVWLAACPLWGQANFGIEGHLENDRLILKINEDALDTPMLLVRNKTGFHQVKWIKEGDFILLFISLIPSETGVLIPPMVKNQFIDNQLLGRFPIINEKSSQAVHSVDVTELFVRTPIHWNIESQESIVPSLTYIKDILQLDNEIIVRTSRTVVRNGDNMTMDVDFNLYLLPKPMRPRLFDHRMAYGNEGTYSPENIEIKSGKGSIERWRLVKRIKQNAVSPPLEPIVFYLDVGIPEKWKPYIKAGIEEWIPAFEDAGFSSAIEVREVPEDLVQGFNLSMNHSMIYWTHNDIRGRDGGGSYCNVVTDFRSGEILKADIYLANPKDLALRYFVRCAPLDTRAHQFPFPDILMGELIQSVTAHETGHAFGLRDGNYGEYAYPFEKTRDTHWLRKMGHVPSIMSYSRHHNLAQVEDAVPPSLLLQRVAPMDHHQIKWGYMVFPGAKSPEDELVHLEALVKNQDSLPWYRFSIKKYPPIGPGATEEVVDNDDPIHSIALGLKNLKRVMELIPVMNKNRRDDVLLESLHETAIKFWYDQMYHVLSMVGGYSIQYKNGMQSGLVYTPIPERDQLLAIDFLLENAFELPKWLSSPEYLSRLYFAHEKDLLLYHQLKLIRELLDPARFKRLEFMEEEHGFHGLQKKLISKLQSGLFKELDEMDIIVGRRRQALQIGYILELESKLNYKRELNSLEGLAGFNRYIHSQYTSSHLMSEIKLLKNKISSSLDSVPDSIFKGHLTICMDYLNSISTKK